MKPSPILILSSESGEASRLGEILTKLGCCTELSTLNMQASVLMGMLKSQVYSLAILDPESVSDECVAETCELLRKHTVPFLLLTHSKPHPAESAISSPSSSELEWHVMTSGRLGVLHRGAPAGEVRLVVEGVLDDLQDRTSHRGHEMHLRAILASVADALVVTDLGGRISFLNAQAERSTGWTQSEALGRALPEVIALCEKETGKPIPCAAMSAICDRIKPVVQQCWLKTRSNNQMLIEFTCSLTRDESGEPTGTVLIFREVKNCSQEQLDQQNETFRRTIADVATRDMDTFTYSIAHDLRAPLRAIHGFSSLLQDSPTLSLDSEHQELLDAIATNAVRMDRMIDEYLRLARVGEGSLHKSHVDMSELVREVWSEISQNRPCPMPELQLVSLPSIWGERGLLHQMWFNLISNAVKFSSKNPHPMIDIGFERREGMVCYWIRDNGVGFSSAQSDRLFLPFRRLHDPLEFPGEGVGLSLVQRIVRKHGGEIQAHSVEGRGAMFRVLFPAFNVEESQPAAPATEGHHAE